MKAEVMAIEGCTLKGKIFSESRVNCGHAADSVAAWAAAAGSIPSKGGLCSKSWYMIMANEYKSTCRSSREAAA